MNGSKWIILLLVVVVVGVVVAKQTRTASETPAPTPIARAPDSPADRVAEPAVNPPAEAEPPAPSAPETPQLAEERPVAPPEVEVETPEDPAPAPTAPPEEEEPPALGPAPKEPLPGSKLKECLKNGLPTLADFGMGTCKACIAMAPFLQQATQDYWGRANILFIELDKYPGLGRQYRVMVMPTQVFFDASGKRVDVHMGFMDRAEIDRRLAAAGVEQ